MNHPLPLRPVVILGPTTVGKTDVAFGLAQNLSAEVINADKFYLYDAMPNVSGQSDAAHYPDVRSHLYGVLKIEDSRWSESRYSVAIKAACQSIQARNRPLIVEGCSNGLVRAAADVLSLFGQSNGAKPLLIGLHWKSGNDLAADCERRAAKMISGCMVQEYRSALRSGLGETYVVRKCFARTPLLAHLRGQIGIAQCRSRVAEALEHHARRHYRQLSRIPGVAWLEHDRQNPENTIVKIMQMACPIGSPINT